VLVPREAQNRDLCTAAGLYRAGIPHIYIVRGGMFVHLWNRGDWGTCVCGRDVCICKSQVCWDQGTFEVERSDVADLFSQGRWDCRILCGAKRS
jgi:hypothetical protein